MAPPTVPGVPAHASRPATPRLMVHRTRPLIVTAASARKRAADLSAVAGSAEVEGTDGAAPDGPIIVTLPPRGRMTRPRSPRSEINTFEPPPRTVTFAPA